MQLGNGEQILKTYHHHPTMFVIRGIKLCVVSLPFFFVGSFFQGVFNPGQMVTLYGSISLVFLLVIAYDILFYYLDKLIVTNHKVIHENWESALSREEHEVELADIQDIGTKETGLISALKIFDFGSFVLETASKGTAVTFNGAPDPEGIKHFIYHLNIKPNRIGAARNLNVDYDRTKRVTGSVEDEASVSRTN
ncbi:hypothetical protein ACFL2V_03020 [Pseudomonadota bacterium]